MPRYLVELCPYGIGNTAEIEVEADNEALARDFAVEDYVRNYARYMDFEFEVTELDDE